MDDIIGRINHALDMAGNRLKWYTITGHEDHIKQCKEWNLIASMYMNQLILEQKHETCES